MKFTIINSERREPSFSRVELGKRIKEMGYEYHRHTNGVVYRMKEI